MPPRKKGKRKGPKNTSNERASTTHAPAPLLGQNWSGAGGDASFRHRRQAKDQRLVDLGGRRLESANRDLQRGNLPMTKLTNEALIAVVESANGRAVPTDKLGAFLASFHEAYTLFFPRLSTYEAIVEKAHALSMEQDFDGVERLTSSLFASFERDVKQIPVPNGYRIVVVGAAETLAYYKRAKVHHHLHDYKGAVSDATEFIVRVRCWGNSGHYTKDFLGSLAVTSDMLCIRAKCLTQLQDFDGAQRDLRAACAGYRLVGNKATQNLIASMSDLLLLMTTAKVNSNAPRPFYSTKEQLKLQKELGIGIFSKSAYRCQECGAEPGGNVKLLLCSGCMEHWFCGKECQRLAGHRVDVDCTYASLIDSSQRQVIKETVGLGGWCEAQNCRGPEILVGDGDDKEGAIFSSLYDKDICFANP